MQLKSYASDILEDAMIMAQSKAINSFSFRDLTNTLTELWSYCYEKICAIDPGYFSKTFQLTSKLCILPPCVKNTVRVYSARDMVDFNRKVYKESGMNDLTAPMTFHISGKQLYCWDGDLRPVWVEYIPEVPFIMFTKNNRDPKIIWRPGTNEPRPEGDFSNKYYGMAELISDPFETPITFVFKHRATGCELDITDKLCRHGYHVTSFILDCPWTFITYKHNILGNYESFIISDLLDACNMVPYNAFDYTGRPTNVEFLKAKYNDYTGLGVTIIDHNDGVVKELGWTPDSLMVYPNRIMYNYMVTTIAQRFAALNGSTNMAVEMALVQATDQMANWMKKNKSAWVRANNVTGPNLSDFL